MINKKIDIDKLKQGDFVHFIDNDAYPHDLEVITCFKHPDINDDYNYIVYFKDWDYSCPLYLNRYGRNESGREYIESVYTSCNIWDYIIENRYYKPLSWEEFKINAIKLGAKYLPVTDHIRYKNIRFRKGGHIIIPTNKKNWPSNVFNNRTPAQMLKFIEILAKE